jgi:hypothetical protein
MRTSDVDYRLLEASKAGDLETVKVSQRLHQGCWTRAAHLT